ncbi:MAG: hypothetical protein IJ721_09150 [Bacteroidales bacterium]|nr:hypothetical protein [Bacteroidales bacterium]
MAGFNFGFFGKQEHRVFNYRPRYFDPEAEERKRLFGDVDGTLDTERKEDTYVPGSSIRGAFRDGNYQKTRSTQSRVQTIISLVTLLLIAVVLVYITKFYSLL